VSTALNEMQFEILPSLSAEEGVVFGIGADVSMDDGGFIPGDDEWENEDQKNPRRGGTAFGRETLNGPTHGFNLHVNASDIPTARAALARIKTAWRAKHIRDNPGVIIPVRYRIDDEVRRFYGRPRRFAAPPDNRILSGMVPITADFAAVDGNFYDDEEQGITLGLATEGEGEGGFTFPTIFPMTTLPSGESEQTAVVGGDSATYPIIRFNGPVTNPRLVADDWTLRLDMTIESTQYVEVDLRPWAMTVLLNGTASVAGKLGLRTYLSDMKFEPGLHLLRFQGSAEASSATCEVRWSNAHNSI
jgi:hypothetical protein